MVMVHMDYVVCRVLLEVVVDHSILGMDRPFDLLYNCKLDYDCVPHI
jgi:hypothetical protein